MKITPTLIRAAVLVIALGAAVALAFAQQSEQAVGAVITVVGMGASFYFSGEQSAAPKARR